eukprot:GHVT01043038.1.p1 GENE.GHVT01043038.1~~GHVT01043038.1.p1  ORF type:complete len:536 (+),score=82.40 GHVT01043038.1:348-1955(+)
MTVRKMQGLLALAILSYFAASSLTVVGVNPEQKKKAKPKQKKEQNSMEVETTKKLPDPEAVVPFDFTAADIERIHGSELVKNRVALFASIAKMAKTKSSDEEKKDEPETLGDELTMALQLIAVWKYVADKVSMPIYKATIAAKDVSKNPGEDSIIFKEDEPINWPAALAGVKQYTRIDDDDIKEQVDITKISERDGGYWLEPEWENKEHEAYENEKEIVMKEVLKQVSKVSVFQEYVAQVSTKIKGAICDEKSNLPLNGSQMMQICVLFMDNSELLVQLGEMDKFWAPIAAFGDLMKKGKPCGACPQCDQEEECLVLADWQKAQPLFMLVNSGDQRVSDLLKFVATNPVLQELAEKVMAANDTKTAEEKTQLFAEVQNDVMQFLKDNGGGKEIAELLQIEMPKQKDPDNSSPSAKPTPLDQVGGGPLAAQVTDNKERAGPVGEISNIGVGIKPTRKSQPSKVSRTTKLAALAGGGLGLFSVLAVHKLVKNHQKRRRNTQDNQCLKPAKSQLAAPQETIEPSKPPSFSSSAISAPN